jgi:F-type H+-transporting ATPase subunit epsilon
MAELRFELVTPERQVMSADVHMVVVPGSEGEFGVMAGHAPFMTTLRDGELAVYRTAGGQPERRSAFRSAAGSPKLVRTA